MCDILDYGCWYSSLTDLIFRALWSFVKPIYDFIWSIISQVIAVCNALIGLFNDIYSLMGTVNGFIDGTFGVLFGEWIGFVKIGFALVVAFRIYSLIRGSKV